MQGSVLELARQAAAAAAARAKQRARGGTRRLRAVRRYRGMMNRGDRYVSEIMDAEGLHFPEPPRGAAGGQQPLLGHARMHVLRQTFPVPQLAPPGLHFRAAAVESSGNDPPVFSHFVYRSGAGFSGISFSAAATGGGSSSGGGLFFGMDCLLP